MLKRNPVTRNTILFEKQGCEMTGLLNFTKNFFFIVLPQINPQTCISLTSPKAKYSGTSPFRYNSQGKNTGLVLLRFRMAYS